MATLEKLEEAVLFERIIENSMDQYIDYVLYEELAKAHVETSVDTYQLESFCAPEVVTEQVQLVAERMKVDEDL